MDDILKNLSLKFSTSELNHLIGCAERVLGAGHWGSSDILIPEEQNLMAMLKKSKGKLKLSPFYLKMLLDWIGTATGEGTVLLPEDESIIETCRSAYENFLKKSDLNDPVKRAELRSLQEAFALLGIKTGPEQDSKKDINGRNKAAEKRTSFTRYDYEEAVFGKNSKDDKETPLSTGKGKVNSLAEALEAGKQQRFFARDESSSKKNDIFEKKPKDSPLPKEEKVQPDSRLTRIRNYIAKIFDGGDQRSFSPGKGRYHKDTDELKDHVEKAEKLQAYMKKKGKKF